MNGDRPHARFARTAFALLIIAAIILRAPQFGNPMYDVDEQFYLLVGERIGHRALPYVDIWDRKPIGLFLIYALASLTGHGVIAFQLIATLCAAATATLIALVARTMAGPVAAIGAGLCYLVWLNLLGGGSGQSPVFYNLATVGAAWAMLSAVMDPARARRLGDTAMAAMGVAMLIKPTSAVEGCLFGIGFLALARHHGASAQAIGVLALRRMAIALAPIVMVLCCYATLGHLDEFWFANVSSIFLRTLPPLSDPMGHLIGIATILLPILTAASFGLAKRWSDDMAPRLLALWLTAAVAAFLAVPPYFNHYALPLLPPLCIAAALAFDGRAHTLWRGGVLILAIAMLILSGFPDVARARTARKRLADATALIARYRPPSGCLFIFEGPPVLYRTSGMCAATRYQFPDHLNSLSEARALGRDSAAEVRRILASHPAMILSADRGGFPDPNPATWSLVEAALAAEYRPIGFTHGDTQRIAIYVRRAPARTE